MTTTPWTRWPVGLAWFAWLVLTATLCTGAHAQTDADTAEALMRKSGLWEQLATMGPHVRTGLLTGVAQSGRSPSTQELERLTRAVDKAFDPDKLRAHARATLAQGGQPQHVAALLAWYDSPRGTEVARMEATAAADSREPSAALREGQALLEKAAAPRRMTLQRLVETTRAAEGMADIAVNLSLGIATGVASANPEAARDRLQAMRQSLKAQRPQLLETFAAVALASFAQTYAALSDADLAAYLAFMESPAGRHYNDLGMEAVDAALSDAAGELGRGIPAAADQANT